MFSLQNTFSFDKEKLADQYVNAWRTDEVFARHDELSKSVLSLADELAAEPHPVIKAKCLRFLLKNAPVYINADDWFGISIEVPKLDPILDVGTYAHRPLTDLNKKWSAEINDTLNLPENAEFIANTRNYLFNELYIDYNHSTPCWEDIFKLGISGILDRARKYRSSHEPLTPEKRAYFDGIEISYTALIDLILRYIRELDGRSEPRLVAMKQALEALSHDPPKNTYEALLLAWIYWFASEQVDGIRVRSMGALDRLYYGFYKRDTESGLFTDDDICEMFVYFMNAFNAIRVHYQQPMYLGGVDKDGVCVVNELSYIVLKAYNILNATNPKLQVIISKNTPDEFLKVTLDTIRSGNSSISIINHDIAEASLLKFGVTEEEARTYLMSGCWDYAVKDHEVKTVPIRVSLPKILEYTISGGICLSTEKEVALCDLKEPESFEEFLENYKKQWLYIQKRAMAIIENWEKYLGVISPANLYSATVTDSLEQGVDGYAEGMKYNNTVYCVCGLATLVDSLCAVKKLVYDTKRLTLKQLTEVLRNNWDGEEKLRQMILRDKDKYGNGSALADGLASSLIDFFAENTNLRPNSRGSFWKLGILSINKNVRFGALMKASADGRLSGEPISKNLSPVIGMDRGGITALINSVTKINFVNFPHSAMLDLVLHPTAVSGEDGLCAFASLVRTYFAKGGHSLQFNVFSAETLIAAQKEPEKYKNLQIRVCGWNVYFVELEKVLQDAFIKEALHREANG